MEMQPASHVGEPPPRCPSAPAQTGALLIGIVQDGRVDLLGTPMEIGQDFVDVAARHGAPERRFRFSVPCAKGSCLHWQGSACGLTAILQAQAADAGLLEPEKALPRCAIRARCQWWLQDKHAACAACALVVYDPTPESAPSPEAGSEATAA